MDKSKRTAGRVVGGTAEPPSDTSSVTPNITAPKDADESSGIASVPIVGIGASAGGLEACTQLLKHLPPDTGLAFVVVQHLDPQHASMMPELLSRKTRMAVREADEGSVLKPNTVFVLPADKNITVSQGVLSLSPRSETAGPHHPIDHFLRSLAADQKSRAIAVILSGSGSDGALGIRAVKDEGGITFAQDEQSAQHAGMPQSAVATGCVDFVLPPEGIASELTRLGRHPYLIHPEPSAGPPGEDAALRQVFALLRSRTGVDFSQYHPATIQRRMQRRMLLTGVRTVGDYVTYLFEHKDEAATLFNDLLIKTTRFFREPGTFEFLQHSIFPPMFKGRPTEATEAPPLRVWAPACATGEEAYSLAISLLESAGASGSRASMQLFASDVSEVAVNQARKGRYPENISADVSTERLRRFFVRGGGRYEIGEPLRKMFVFAKHDLLHDPPFSRMDLVSCRNLLIYLGPAAQRRALSALHYALKPGGILLLGAAEGVGQAPHLFHQIDRRYKIFTKQPAEEHFRLEGPRKYLPAELPRSEDLTAADLHGEADRLTLQHYSFPSVLINEDMNILQFRGDTSPYIKPAAGKASLNVLDMVREELRLGLRAAIVKAKKGALPARKSRLRLTGRGQFRNINVEVAPIRIASSPERLFLVVFREGGVLQIPEPEQGRAGRGKSGKDNAVVSRLKRELVETKEELKSALEDHQASIEELQAANEELQSANEELQSSNEELETSKEEIEATNEELTTVNAEMQARNRELTTLSEFIGAVFDTVREPLVLLDASLRVRQANRSFYEGFRVEPGETVGRFLGELGTRQWAIPEVIRLLETVLPSQSAFEKFELEADFPSIGHKRMTLSARPVPFVKETPAILLAIEDTTSESIIRDQQKVIRELSTPVLPIGNRVLILPIIGMLDAGRARQLREQLLEAIHLHRAKVVVIDITGVATVDAEIAQALMQTAETSRLLGATIILTGISRQTAQALADLGVSPSKLTGVSDLQRGIEEANRLLGYEVITTHELAALREAMRELMALSEDEQAG